MSAPIVQAQYEQLEQIAARFAAAAEQQQALLERVNRQVDVLRGGSWQGRGVATFLREMDGEVGPAGQRLCDGLKQTSQTTQQIAAIIRTAEERAGQLFETEESMRVYPNPGIARFDEVVLPDSGDRSSETTPSDTPATTAGSSSGMNKTQEENFEEIKQQIRRDLGRLPNERGEQCVAWVADRVHQVTGHRPPAIGNYGSDVGADNYRFMFNGVRQFNNENTGSLLGATSPGSILVWTRGQLGNGAGHVAVVERVTNEGVYISEANWGKREGVRFISNDDLAKQALYLIPAGATATAATAGQFAERKRSTT